MAIVEAIIKALIALAFIVLAFYVIEWVLMQLGIPVPQTVSKVILVILVLIGGLVIVRALGPHIGGWTS